MKTFTDQYGRIHDVETNGIHSSSDNGWLYSAVAKKVGVEINLNPSAAEYCAENLERHPMTVANRPYVPMSRDEILGLAYLGYLKKHHLKGWNFSPYPLPKLNPVKLVQQLWRIRKEHRTFFWRNNLDQVYHVAFMVPLQDRHFLLQQWGEYNFFYHFIHILDSLRSPTDRSSRQIRFLKTGKDKAGVVNYYSDKDHPSVQKALE